MAKPNDILRLLLIDDSLTSADAITTLLRKAGHTVRAERHDDMDTVKTVLSDKSWDMILCKDSVPNITPEILVGYLNNLGKDVPCVILITDNQPDEALYELGVQDIISVEETKRLEFVVAREIKNLFIRRLNRRNEGALRESEKRSRLLLEISSDAVAYMHEGMHIYSNQAYLDLFGYQDSEDIDGLPMMDMLLSSEQQKFKSFIREFSENKKSKAKNIDIVCLGEGDREFEANIEFRHASVEGEACIQVTVREQQQAGVTGQQTSLVREFDELTGLHTRQRFIDELEQVSVKINDGNEVYQLLFMVIDEFQSIKDQVGLTNSESILKSVADSLSATLIDGEFLASYSDQVFTALIPSGDDDYVDQRAKLFSQAISASAAKFNGSPIKLKCSIGISRITESLNSLEEGLDNADKACVDAQRAGGECISRYHVPLTEQEAENKEQEIWVARMEQALQNDEFNLFYQPIVSLHGEAQEFYDVLLRLKGTDDTIIPARDFIDYAVQPELIQKIDYWVIENALATLARHRQTHPKTRFFIKLSKETLLAPTFIEWLFAQLKTHDFSGSVVVFEMSETDIMDNLNASQAVITQLKKVGCEFGLEHFGSGLEFSQSLSVLDVDYLKINGKFVENMAKDKENQAAVKATIEMAKQADKKSIAEFVSDASSLALLWRLEVDYALGYYIQEPSAELNFNFDDDE